jgi:hypothetical protein
MGELINLNKARKARDKAAAKAKAVENRVRHGRTGAQKALEQSHADKLRAELDQLRRDHEDLCGDRKDR